MSYISVIFLAASSQSLSQLWSLFKQNFPWKPTWGVCLGLSSCCVAPLWVPSNRLKRKPKMSSVQKNTKAACKAAPTHDLPPELWWSFHWEALSKFEHFHLCCYSEKRKKTHHVSQNVILAKFTEELWPELQWHIRMIISVQILTDPNMYRHRGVQNEGNTSRHERSFSGSTIYIYNRANSALLWLMSVKNLCPLKMLKDLRGTFKAGVSDSY